MEERTYGVYWYKFKGYRGGGLTDYNKKYRGVLYKIGHQYNNGDELNRMKENTKRDKGIKPVWEDLFTEIECIKFVGKWTKAQAKMIEDSILKELGKKDFSLVENISGIREFRVATPERMKKLVTIFDEGLSIIERARKGRESI